LTTYEFSAKDFYYNFVITTQTYKFGAETHLGGRVMTAFVFPSTECSLRL